MTTAKTIAKTFPTLTAREASVLACIAQGMDNATIAATLGVTERTVKNTLGPVCLKVGVPGGGSSRVKLCLAAHGLPYHEG